MVLQLLHAHRVSTAKTEHVSNTNILVRQALFQLRERLVKLIVLVAQVETTVEREDFRM